uniref:Uncharacterized protein n=1 Tax=Candidatus Kentrum sp. SD TaxID=2126332 RepID=A0A451BKX5_9GAMM|nr:MAG: hypothetical protein BECKSD772D_GA0070982_10306 [Candidatus Kentron sp. SD]
MYPCAIVFICTSGQDFRGRNPRRATYCEVKREIYSLDLSLRKELGQCRVLTAMLLEFDQELPLADGISFGDRDILDGPRHG